MHKSRPIWFRVLHKIHLWVGLILCIPLVLIGLTGSLLVYQDNLKDIFSKPVELAKGESHSVAEIINAAAQSAPPNLKPSMYRASDGKHPASVRFSKPGGKSGPGGVQISVDPVSLKTEKISNQDFFRQVQSLHSSLLLRDFGGRSIVGWLGIIMFSMGITGLIMWWPKKGRLKSALTIKKGATGLRLHRDLHGAAGIWGYFVFIIICFSGVYLAFPQSVGSIFTSRDLRAGVNIAPGSNPIDLNAAIKLAQDAVPNTKLVAVMLPQKPEQPYRINLTPPDYPNGAPAIIVFVDQYKGKIAEIRDPNKSSAGEAFVIWQHALHSGNGPGWLWKFLVFVTGFSPLLFSVTGISMWLIKRRAKAG